MSLRPACNPNPCCALGHAGTRNAGGVVKGRASLPLERTDGTMLPPIVRETPVPGDGCAAVFFEPNPASQTALGYFSESDSGAYRFIASSSPEGHSGVGTASPVVVCGLTNGRAYTFSVVAETEDRSEARKLRPAITLFPRPSNLTKRFDPP